jgi:hypothetical protein
LTSNNKDNGYITREVHCVTRLLLAKKVSPINTDGQLIEVYHGAITVQHVKKWGSWKMMERAPTVNAQVGPAHNEWM